MDPFDQTAVRAITDIRNTDLIFIPTTGLNDRQRGRAQCASRAVAAALAQTRSRHRQRVLRSGVGRSHRHARRQARHHSLGLAERFREKYPKVKWMPELMVTEDRDFYCGGGVHAALDLSLYLVEKFCGHDVAMQTAKAMLIDTPRAWQAGFAIVPLKTEHNDDAISKAQEWLHENFHRTFPLDALARRVGMSLRNFVRRFKQATGDSPLIYLQKLRIAAAKRLLESDHRTMQEISDAVGYQDVAFFREIFQRHTGDSFRAYRERFGV